VGYLFLDMNAYFASVEQQLRPELRGRPVGIVAVVTDTTCCIAASYEAKAHGVKTGTLVAHAKKLCPTIRIVEARPDLYVRHHHAIRDAVESCLHVDAIHSIDEMSCRLMGVERDPQRARALAQRVKQAVRRQVGEYLRCSIGLAPNRFLAKVAADMEKPDGLVVITPDQLPHRLYGLKLDDLPGIGTQMLKRLYRHGVATVEKLCALSEKELTAVWQSVIGELWWHWLRGHDLPDRPTQRRTVGHSHVLPPAWRSPEGAHAVLIRLIHKAAMRLRHMQYWAGRMAVYLSMTDGRRWEENASMGLCQDTLTMLEAFERMWTRRPAGEPFKVGITLYRLLHETCVTPPLFPAQRNRILLARAMDGLNTRFGAHTVYFGGMYAAQDSAPMRIAFTCIPDLDLPA